MKMTVLITIIESNGSDKASICTGERNCLCDENRIFEYLNMKCSQLNAFNAVPNRVNIDNGSINNSQNIAKTKRSRKMLWEQKKVRIN